MTKINRIYWLDGLKGLACVFIFLHHFCLKYFPAIHYGKTVYKATDMYILSTLIYLIISFIVIVLFSEIFNSFLYSRFNKFVNKILG